MRRAARSAPGTKAVRSVVSWRRVRVCPSGPEDDLLVRDQTRQAQRVDRHAGLAAPPARGCSGRSRQMRARGASRPAAARAAADPPGRRERRPARRVDLALVVQLDDLDVGHVRGHLLGGTHQQHRPDGEVRCDQAVRGAGPVTQILDVRPTTAPSHRRPRGRRGRAATRRSRARSPGSRPRWRPARPGVGHRASARRRDRRARRVRGRRPPRSPRRARCRAARRHRRQRPAVTEASGGTGLERAAGVGVDGAHRRQREGAAEEVAARRRRPRPA